MILFQSDRVWLFSDCIKISPMVLRFYLFFQLGSLVLQTHNFIRGPKIKISFSTFLYSGFFFSKLENMDQYYCPLSPTESNHLEAKQEKIISHISHTCSKGDKIAFALYKNIPIALLPSHTDSSAFAYNINTYMTLLSV